MAADLTHLKQAHALLTDNQTYGGVIRAERFTRAQAFATMAVAEALHRIADLMEAERSEDATAP